MIVPTYTEDEILRELINDFKYIKRRARKYSDTYLNKVRVKGGYVRETDYEAHSIISPLKNEWFVLIEYNQTKKIPWVLRACCRVESDKKTKDYYLLRGLSTNEPYYVKLTSHTLKRIKERNNFSMIKVLPLDVYALLAFEHREVGVCIRNIDLKFLKMLGNLEDADDIDSDSYIVFINRGTFYATRTPKGNFIFKTYISTMMGFTEITNYTQQKSSKWNKEGELLYTMSIIHQNFNKSMYSKDVLDKMLYSAIDKDQELVVTDNNNILLLRN